MKHVKQLQQARAKEAGFTLVELAIVLVIIGLIIGGVLVGQDLIKAAEIRSTTADIERYNAAANTFRNKYNGLPGDLRASRAEQSGMEDRTGAAGHGDGNGLIEGCAVGSPNLGCETALFWTDLTRAQLISSAFDEATDAEVTAATVDAIADYLPSAPLRDSAFVSIFPQGGRNYYGLASFSGVAAGVHTFANPGVQALSPLEASQIDDKMDDGAPLSGIVRAIADWTTAATADDPADGDTCVVDPGGTADPRYYLEDSDVESTLNCAISIRASF